MGGSEVGVAGSEVVGSGAVRTGVVSEMTNVQSGAD